jgi:hypothetical protein
VEKELFSKTVEKQRKFLNIINRQKISVGVKRLIKVDSKTKELIVNSYKGERLSFGLS